MFDRIQRWLRNRNRQREENEKKKTETERQRISNIMNGPYGPSGDPNKKAPYDNETHLEKQRKFYVKQNEKTTEEQRQIMEELESSNRARRTLISYKNNNDDDREDDRLSHQPYFSNPLND